MDRRPFGFASLVVVAGCCGMCAETTPSENIRTEGLSEEVTVETTGKGTTQVSVRLRAGGPLSNLYPRIGTADRLEVRTPTALVPLVFDKGFVASPIYRGEVPGDAGRLFEILFTRTGNTSATGTQVTLPTAFTLAKPTFARPTLTLAWSPASGEPMSWQVEGDCIVTRGGLESPDTGRLEVALRAATPPDGGAPLGRCEAKVRLVRARRGMIDPAFGEGGSIDARQIRETTVEVTP